MPEGAQVHLVGLRHAELFAGKRLRVESPDLRSQEVAEAFDGRRLSRIDVVGKHLLYVFDRDRILHVHLGRFGKFRVGELPLPEASAALRFRLHSATHWAELRGATTIEYYDDASRKLLEARIGPDPLNDDDPMRGFEKIRSRRSAIGGLLMDQSIVAGVGNIYRAEMLFRAGVSPYRAGKACDVALLERMWHDVHGLMEYSLRHDGRIVTTEPVDRPASSRRRRVVPRTDAFYVYKRAGKPCRRCGTAIEQDEMAARTVFFCPSCQPE